MYGCEKGEKLNFKEHYYYYYAMRVKSREICMYVCIPIGLIKTKNKQK